MDQTRAKRWTISLEYYKSSIEKACYNERDCSYEEYIERAEDVGLAERSEINKKMHDIRYDQCIKHLADVKGVDKKHCVAQFKKGIANENSYYCTPMCQFKKNTNAENAQDKHGPNWKIQTKSRKTPSQNPEAEGSNSGPQVGPVWHLDPTGPPLPKHLTDAPDSSE